VGIGLAMVVLPGPAIVVIPAGLAILATEFAWARYLLRRMKEKTEKFAQRARRGR
jgi:tellurite resistance protein TerC